MTMIFPFELRLSTRVTAMLNHTDFSHRSDIIREFDEVDVQLAQT